MPWYNPFSWGASEKNIDDILDKDNGLLTQVGGWIGNMNYTAEERAEMNKTMADGATKFVVDTLSENTVRSKARRDIAILWIKFELLIIFMSAVIAPFNMEVAKFWLSLAFSELMFWGTMSVLAFFFGPYMLSNHMGVKKSN